MSGATTIGWSEDGIVDMNCYPSIIALPDICEFNLVHQTTHIQKPRSHLGKTLPLDAQGGIEGGLEVQRPYSAKLAPLLRKTLISTATLVLALALASCGSGNSAQEATQIESTSAPAPQAPTATIAPTPTETPYWAKNIVPGIAMEQYPPLNTRTDYELKNTQEWLNGEPTTIADIRNSGKVVLVDFWTYT